jgi:hypothetical protein
LSALSGTTGNIGGTLTGNTCTSGTVSITGATTSMVAVASPVTYPGDGILWSAQVTAVDQVTVRVCNYTQNSQLATTSQYRVRVIQ